MPRRSQDSDSSPTATPKVKVTRESLAQMFSLYGYLRPYRGRLALGIVLLIFSSMLGILFPKLAGQLIDSPNHEAAFHFMLFMLGILFVQALTTYFSSMCFNTVGEYGLADLRKALFAHLTEMPMTFFGQKQVGELTSRMSADLTQLQDAFVFAVPQFLRQSLIMLGSIIFIACISPRLTGVMLACFPPTIIGAILLGRRVGKRSRVTQDALAQTANVVEEALQGIASVKAFCNEFYEQKRYGSRIDVFLAAVLRGAKARAALIAFIIFGIFSAIVVVLWYGTTLLLDGTLRKGQFFEFTIFTMFIGGSLGSFADLYSNLQKSIGATQRVRELLAEPSERKALAALRPDGAGAKERFRGDVGFDHVTFAYPSRSEVNVLKNLTFTVEAGKVVALVGPSGSGKSTIAALLLRFYDPQQGRILFDGRPATGYGLHELRGQMALVPQEVLLFGGSIAENIAYGKTDAARAEIESAAKRANAHEFIAKFPEGYETPVGERGVKVSGGQRQRIAIARALLKDPSILILDEATSALDAESELLVQQALEELMKGRTCFVIAHRLSTIRNADVIVMLREGTVLETGSHEELMGVAGGAYRRMVELQNGANILSEEAETAAVE
ncbi:MAG TPA: ABC transporter transmembrane domain-containing protein [Candidatus Methylacidiphilales bacterium]|nr:ABC transporter transmembrane domain-containing protein [Candidatus Methylacidiphilales bacterium]